MVLACRGKREEVKEHGEVWGGGNNGIAYGAGRRAGVKVIREVYREANSMRGKMRGELG